MTTFFRRVLGLVAGATVVAGLTYAGATPVSAASSSSSAKQWANGVCSAFQTFGDSVQSTLSGLSGSDSLDDASSDVKSGLDDATKQLEDSLQKLGKPPTPNASKAQSTIQNLSKELQSDADDVEQLLSPPPSTPQEIASTFSQIGSEVQKAVNQVQSTASTLQGLKGNNALKQGFQSASACKQLEQSL
jgi:hypothetical protein